MKRANFDVLAAVVILAAMWTCAAVLPDPREGPAAVPVAFEPPPPHSEQGEFRAAVVTADGDAWLFYTEAEMTAWLYSGCDEPVIFAGSWGELCVWYYWPGLRIRLSHILAAGAEG